MIARIVPALGPDQASDLIPRRSPSNTSQNSDRPRMVWSLPWRAAVCPMPARLTMNYGRKQPRNATR